MIVVSDTSPLSSLYLIDHLFLPLMSDLRTKASFHIHDNLFNEVLSRSRELDEDQDS